MIELGKPHRVIGGHELVEDTFDDDGGYRTRYAPVIGVGPNVGLIVIPVESMGVSSHPENLLGTVYRCNAAGDRQIADRYGNLTPTSGFSEHILEPLPDDPPAVKAEEKEKELTE
jgi:hypothetical protein